jgi:hypothetical protein
MMVTTLEDAMELIRLEYHELPALALTFWQAQRLWHLSDQVCELALQSLVRDRFLMVTSSGTFVRRPNRDSMWARPAHSPRQPDRPTSAH